MFEMFKDLIRKRKEEGKKIPLHVGVTMNGIEAWASKNNKMNVDAYVKAFSLLREMIKAQVELNLRILSVYIVPSYMRNSAELIGALTEFLKALGKDSLISQNQIKVSIIGKWYDLESDIIDPIKDLIAETKDYDRFFLNFCINYNGKEEIVDAVKMIARKIQAEKLDPELIDKSLVKDNLYTSYFMPPDLIIKTGYKKQLFGFLLWDSHRSEIKFTGTLWPDYNSDKFKSDVRSFGE
ncbi:di-trans,poly-cis-decaprenylcistransferase [Candidatus Woesearchaeota archaeon]|nr:di-trans,poly-cis-decaprenylcistransferase [Candidatus Woesearchaeota archaeon]